jgi:3'(2'), 5'-bisphosphate nucleotidase
MSYVREREAALAAVTEAAALCQAVRSEMVDVGALEKGDRSPVTVADFGAQALVCRRLKSAFPQDPIVGEEDAAALRAPENAGKLGRVVAYVRRFQPQATPDTVCRWIDAGNGSVADRFWTLDPIDGTKGFLRDDQYAIALALIVDGEVELGALACPALPLRLDEPGSPVGVLFFAVRGEGAQMAHVGSKDFVPIHVTEVEDEARWRFVESVESSHGNPALQEAVAQAVGVMRPPLKLDSQAKYGAVARGDAVLYLRLPSPGSPGYHEKIWDHAAGAVLVEEAGGRVTDMAGRPLDLASGHRMTDNRGVVVSNGALHPAVIAALADQAS